jgi:hypothetical protein
MRLAARFPQAAIASAGALAWATQPLSRGVAPERIAAILPNLSPAELETARRATWASHLRGQALAAAFAAGGSRPVHPRVVAGYPPAGVRAPMVLASFHIGALYALGATLERLPGETLVLHATRFLTVRPGVTLLDVGGDEWSRAAAFHRALSTLRGGGFVFVTVDSRPEATVSATLLGRPISLTRGAFALAHMAGAPLVPLVTRWRGTGIELHWGDPIEPTDEEGIAAAAATWLEGYLLAYPGEVSAELLKLFEAPS